MKSVSLTSFASSCLIALLGIVLSTSCNTLSEQQEEMRLVIREGNRFGYIDLNGDVVVRPEFDYLNQYSEGKGAFNIGGKVSGWNMPTDGKWGFINGFGQIVINPKYDPPPVSGAPYNFSGLAYAMNEAYIFSEGLAPVRMGNEWVWINHYDSIVIRNPEIESVRRFSDSLAAVYINGAWGYMDHSGQIVFEPKYLYPVNFRQGVAMVIDQQYRRMVLRSNGTVDSMLAIFRIESEFYDGIATVRDRFRGQPTGSPDDLRYSVIDQTGKILFEPQFDKIGRFGSGLLPVLVGSKPGEQIISPEISGPIENRGGRWGYVNLNGQFVFNPNFQDAHGFSEGLAAVKKGGYWGYMNEDGSMVTAFEFLWAGYFKNGIAQVRLGPVHNDYVGQYAYLNADGEVIWINPL